MKALSIFDDLNMLVDVAAINIPVLADAVASLRELFGLPVIVQYRQIIEETVDEKGQTRHTIKAPTEFILRVVSPTGVSLGYTNVRLMRPGEWYAGGTCSGMFIESTVNNAWRARCSEIERRWRGV